MKNRRPELQYAIADDGWPLALRLYPAEGADPHRQPVLLQHGLGTSSLQFDLPVAPGSPTPSLARWLVMRGYDVWVGDLRGAGESAESGRGKGPSKKQLGGRRGQWDFTVDDHLRLDMPAFLRHVLERSSYQNLHWVGHSLGGILLLCYCALRGADNVASGIVAAAGMDYSGHTSRYDWIVPLRRVGRAVKRIPAGTFARMFAPLFGRYANPLEATFYHSANMDPAAARLFIREAQFDISGVALHQLASLFQPGGLRSSDDKIRYAEQAHRVRSPLLLVSGDRDLQCTPEVVQATHLLLAGDQHKHMTFGLAGGQAGHYGHVDLLSGRRSAEEIYPHLLRWMQAHPATQRAAP